MRARLDARSMVIIKLFRMLGLAMTGLLMRGVVSEASSLASSRLSLVGAEDDKEEQAMQRKVIVECMTRITVMTPRAFTIFKVMNFSSIIPWEKAVPKLKAVKPMVVRTC